MQLESLETEDTSIKQVYVPGHQNAGPTQAQNAGDIDERTAQDIISSQIQDDGTNLKNNDDEYISEDQNPAIPDDQTSKASQDDNYCTAIDDHNLDDTVQFGNPVTQPFLSRSIRIPTTEVGCLSFTQMFQDYLHAYPPPS